MLAQKGDRGHGQDDARGYPGGDAFGQDHSAEDHSDDRAGTTPQRCADLQKNRSPTSEKPIGNGCLNDLQVSCRAAQERETAAWSVTADRLSVREPMLGSTLVQTVRRWWFEADAWRDPDAQREFLARVERYQREGPPPPAERISRQEIRVRYGV